MDESHWMARVIKVGNEDEKEDRISSLPDSILSHILSFLPTKYAVATCILSSRWRFVWTSLTNLCFDERLVLNPARCDRGSNGFENFVNRVLFFTHPAKFDKFSLHCSKVLCSLKFWVSSAIMRNVREIELNLGRHRHAELPDSIYTSKALEILKLNSVFNLKIPPSGICFPSVKILHLELFEPANSLIERLFSICPVLEDLSIKIYGLYPDSVINIISPTLKRLTVRVGSLEEDERILLICGPKNVLYHMDRKVMIKAPNLNCLYIEDGTLVPYMLHELHSLSEVSLKLSCTGDKRIHAHHVLEFLKGSTKARFLYLSEGAMFGLSDHDESLFPTFPNLTYLKVDIGEDRWQMLPIILSSSPKLEVMDICLEEPSGFEKPAWSKALKEFVWDKTVVWNELERVPHCLLLHTKKIVIKECYGIDYELELIKYLLKNCEVLESMIIHNMKWASKEKKRELCQEILMFERGSETCEVKFA